MYRTWRPGGAQEAAAVLGSYNYASAGYSNPGEHEAGAQMSLEGLYQTGRRFSLAGWSADEWAKFFESAGSAASQVIGTATRAPIAQPPVAVVQTPVGGIPTWALLGLVAVGGYFLLSSRRR